MRLSVCFLTRNQEADLPRALRSVAPVAAECLVVDTGSTDRTAGVAEENGARVLSFAWEEDFSAGRNFAVRQAAGEWVLWMNADEELLPESVVAFEECMGRENLFGYFVRVLHTPNPATPDRPADTADLRLFRRRPDLPFVGRLHPAHGPESLEVIRKEGLRVAACNVALRSHAPPGGLDETKLQWIRRLLELELADRPGNLHYLIEYGRVLLRLGDAKGHEVLAQAVEQVLPLRDAPNAPSFKVQVLLEYLLNVPPEVTRSRLTRKEARALARRWFPSSPTLLYRVAEQEFREGDSARAAEALESLIGLGQSGAYDRSQVFDPALIADDSLMNLAACYLQLGRLDDAERCYRMLLGSKSQNAQAVQGLSAVAQLRRGRLS